MAIASVEVGNVQGENPLQNVALMIKGIDNTTSAHHRADDRGTNNSWSA